ncbi:XRE family transcriptional regulator [Achromobacter seleniivolatilans]|uniref:XRE family transcriptional regulator n=1 Tax=Achromobacter seleniivolatilans TaxID=3047478 RepID=A0ABY9M9Q6_9BURK|nr:XRE family transcriptional regulator [Achromobacter sp. R39]WMD23329.1 XRE family transcriptional regulator [Achromobacter sp. R39]
MGENIRQRRKALGWTILELANRIGSDVGNLSRLERGKQGFSDEILAKIADALGCSVGELFTGAPAESNIQVAAIGSRRIPLLSYVQAGALSESVVPYPSPSPDDWLLTDLDLSRNAFALRIKGLSMYSPMNEESFNEGDIVVIDPAVEPLPGDFVVAKNGDHEATFKKYRPRGVTERGEMVFELVPLNPDYPSVRSDVSAVQIIGTMVEHRRYRKRR